MQIFQKINAFVHLVKKKRNLQIDPEVLLKEVQQNARQGMSDEEVWTLYAECAVSWQTKSLEWEKIAAALEVQYLHNTTDKSIKKVANALFNCTDVLTKRKTPMITEKLRDFMVANYQRLDKMFNFEADFEFSFFGIRTLRRSYLMKANKKIIERPQHMLLRVACSLHLGDLELIAETYNMLADKLYTHASPTLLNAGTKLPQNSSCFLLPVKDDSIQGIFETLTQVALISKTAGRVGLSVSKPSLTVQPTSRLPRALYLPRPIPTPHHTSSQFFLAPQFPLTMFVIKRDGRKEPVHFDKITSRIKKLCYGLNANYVDPAVLAQKVHSWCFFFSFSFSRWWSARLSIEKILYCNHFWAYLENIRTTE